MLTGSKHSATCYGDRPTPCSQTQLEFMLPSSWLHALTQMDTPCILGKQEAHQGSTKQAEPPCRDCRPKDKEKREAAVVKAIMRKIFVNLKRLHGMGIVHRDVKPVSDMPRSMFMTTSWACDHEPPGSSVTNLTSSPLHGERNTAIG
jgi:hypothetical protein